MTTTAEVINYHDVWGHGPSECRDYDCPCMVKTGADDDDQPETVEHDDNRCECRYEINDMSKAGTLDLPDDATDEVLIALMVAEGYFNDKATSETIEVDNRQNGSIDFNDSKTGCPLFGLRFEV